MSNGSSVETSFWGAKANCEHEEQEDLVVAFMIAMIREVRHRLLFNTRSILRRRQEKRPLLLSNLLFVLHFHLFQSSERKSEKEGRSEGSKQRRGREDERNLRRDQVVKDVVGEGGSGAKPQLELFRQSL